MILVIDHYDSFVYNLARYVSRLGGTPVVQRYDTLTLADIQAMNPSHIIISPGPCTPKEAGVSVDLIRAYSKRLAATPILGVCLGHQVIGYALGGKITRAKQPRHGMSDTIKHTGEGLFQALNNSLIVGLYHSLVIDTNTLPDDLSVTAWSSAGDIMAVQHQHLPIFGVQFHPESILTNQGTTILVQFLSLNTL